VSSLLVAAGNPGHIVALLDPDSDLVETLHATGTAVVQLLQWQHRHLADAFAGQAPAPGGVFRLAQWTQSRWGPVLDDASAWAGVRLTETEPAPVGWSLLVDTVIEHVELRKEAAPLLSRRGRYSKLPADADSGRPSPT
jgi:flavin reductase (DIM6/NTAB) family NADH-FMN oxidoreductase RutF